MAPGTLAAALEREHREIDAGIEAFLAALERGAVERVPLARALDALRRHIYLEEEHLFPPLRAAGLFAPIVVMLREHGEIWDTMAALEAELDCDAPRAAEACRRLLAQLDAHNAKKEPIVYPEADIKLTPAAAAKLRAFMASGRLPGGWACAKAGGTIA